MKSSWFWNGHHTREAKYTYVYIKYIYVDKLDRRRKRETAEGKERKKETNKQTNKQRETEEKRNQS